MRGEDRRQKDMHGNRTPRQKAPVRQRLKKTRQTNNEAINETKSTGEEEKGEEEEEERTDAV